MHPSVTIMIPAMLLSAQYHSLAQTGTATDTTVNRTVLKEITVTSRKPALETAPGKTIMNVQAMAGTGGKDILDVLRRMPGVNVDGQGNITITGKDGVLVTIDGRQTYLNGSDLRDYLQSMTAEEVNQVELITQPFAMYDAEGNSGVINIKTRKSKRRGLNGNATAAYTQSIYHASHNTLLVNYRIKKANLYSSVNYINAASNVNWRNEIQFKDSTGKINGLSNTHSTPTEVFEKHNWRIGADYDHSNNTTTGIKFTGAYYTNTMYALTNTTANDINSSPVYNFRNTGESSLRRNAGVNAYLTHKTGKRSELKIDVDYLLYTRIMSQTLNTRAYQYGMPLPNQLMLRMELPYNMQVWSAKADYVTTITNGWKIESGAKQSYVIIDRAGLFTTYNNGYWVHDTTRTNRLLFNEQISALYINGVKKINDKWEMQVGLRGETANMQGQQLATGQVFSRVLPALFPTGYATYQPDSANNIALNYGRRVERPGYNMLNPFNYYTFYNTYQRGNPTLLPAYTHNLELRHNYKNTLTTTLQLSLTTDMISDVVQADNQSKATYGTPINFGTARQVNLSVLYKATPHPWWELMVNVSGQAASFTGLFNNTPISKNGFAISGWVSNQFIIKKWTAECWASYSGNRVVTPITTEKATIYTYLACSRKVLHDTTTVKLSVDDPFYLYRNVYYNLQPGMNNVATFQPNNRNCTFSMTYNFGKNRERISEQRNKTPEEANRM